MRALILRLLITDLDLDIAVLAECLLLSLLLIRVVADLRVGHLHRHLLTHVVIMVRNTRLLIHAHVHLMLLVAGCGN